MNENLPVEDLLMKYLDNEMSLSEREEFENQLNANAQLKAQMESLVLARKAVEYYGIHEEVSKVRKEFQQTTGSQQEGKLVKMRRPLRYIFMAAASVLVIGLIAVGYLLYELSPEKVYNESFVSYNISATRGTDASLTKIEKAYQEKNYSEVIQDSKTNSVSEKDHLLTGLSYMQLKRFNEATGQFGEILKDAHATYKPDAEYYLALSQLRLKKYDEALVIFKKINADQSHLYHKQVSSGMLREIAWLKWKR
ncbi:MAG: hypothetical protein ACJ749_18725 [Flavisolibacter sp.]